MLSWIEIFARLMVKSDGWTLPSILSCWCIIAIVTDYWWLWCVFCSYWYLQLHLYDSLVLLLVPSTSFMLSFRSFVAFLAVYWSNFVSFWFPEPLLWAPWDNFWFFWFTGLLLWAPHAGTINQMFCNDSDSFLEQLVQFFGLYYYSRWGCGQ